MTSTQRVALYRLLESHPDIRQHADPIWKLKRLQPAQLVELAAKLGIDFSHLLDPRDWTPAPAVRKRATVAKSKKPSTPKTAEPHSPAPGVLRLVRDDSTSAPTGPLRVAAANTDLDIRREHATAQVRWALQELAANMLRVIRGAGRPHEIADQNLTLLKAMNAYHEVVGFWPSGYEISESLRFGERSEEVAQRSEAASLSWYAEHRVMRGALQAVASSLLGQLTQERAGEHEMHGGINDILEIRAEARARWAAESAASRSTAGHQAKAAHEAAKRPSKPRGAATKPPGGSR